MKRTAFSARFTLKPSDGSADSCPFVKRVFDMVRQLRQFVARRVKSRSGSARIGLAVKVVQAKLVPVRCVSAVVFSCGCILPGLSRRCELWQRLAVMDGLAWAVQCLPGYCWAWQSRTGDVS